MIALRTLIVLTYFVRITFFFILITDVVIAEPSKSGGDAAIVQTLRKAQGMLRQLSQEKSDLEAKNVELETQINTLKASEASLQTKVMQLEPLQNQLNQAKIAIETLQNNNTTLQQNIAKQASHLQTISEQGRKVLTESARYKEDNSLLVHAVKEREAWIKECGDKNQSLVVLNQEVITRFEKRDFWEALAEHEPLTGLGKVEKENTIQTFQYQLSDLKITPWHTDIEVSTATSPSPVPEGTSPLSEEESED